MKQLTIIAVTLILSMVILAFNSSPENKVKTVAFTSNNSAETIIKINKWSDYGYSVKFIVSQSVSVSNAYDGSSYGREKFTQIKGDIIVVMELKN